MQDITPPLSADAQLIRSYGPQGFRIGNTDHATHVLVLPDSTLPWNGELALEAIMPLMTAFPLVELLLIGTGKHHQLVDVSFRKELRNKGVSNDTMDTGAACRTFNILLGEGRRAAALLRLPA